MSKILIAAMLLMGGTAAAQAPQQHVIVGGNVFGGGNKAYVAGSSTVLVNQTGATIGGDVYGGGAKANVNSSDGSNRTADAVTTVTITTGTVQGNVYGGGLGDLASQGEGHTNVEAKVFGPVTVNINGSNATINHSVYGCNNLNGAPQNSVTVTLTNGTVSEDVYGGGNLANASVSPIVNINGGTVGRDVYGGGALASTGANEGTTQVNINAGTISGDIYGGGLGEKAKVEVRDGEDNIIQDASAGIAAVVNGNVHVKIGDGTYNAGVTGRATSLSGSATIGGSVYGCNNLNGSPTGNVNVDVFQTAHTLDNTYPNTITTLAALETASANYNTSAYADNFAIKSVYGGGNQAAYTAAGKTATVHIYTCVNTIQSVYGGGNAADATNVQLIIEGGRFDHVFGGGNGYSESSNHDKPYADGAGHCTLTPTTTACADYNPGANISGSATTQIHGGLYRQLFGGSNQYGDVGSASISIDDAAGCTELILESFGGANEADITGNVTTNLLCGNTNIGTFYGGSNAASITGNVTLNVYGGHYTNVFGGSKGVIDDPGTNDNEAVDADITGNVTLNLFGGTMVNAFGGSDQNGNITGSITVNMLDFGGTCGLEVNNIYGGGNLTEYRPSNPAIASPTVNLIHGTVSKDNGNYGNVFGGSYGNGATVYANPVVNIGYDATLMGTANENGKLLKSLLNNAAVDYTPVADNSEEHPYLVTVGANVYGGGALANVNGNTTVAIRKDNTVVTEDVYGGGALANVGTVGTTTHTVTLTDCRSVRTVYGGGMGDGNTAALVNGNTVVNINGGTVSGTEIVSGINGGVFGGCNVNGTVKGNATVAFSTGGTVGSNLVHANVYGGGLGASTNVQGTVTMTLGSGSTINGDVYGGSAKGLVNCTLDNESNQSRTANAVTGVSLGGATVNGDIYGGGHGIGSAAANVWGPVTVTVNSGTVTDVFGCNNAAGAPQGTVQVNINGNVGRNVYGGGNVAAYGGTPDVNITAGTVSGSVYGGGNQAGVGGGDVAMTGGTVTSGLYGGCNTSGVVNGDIAVSITSGTIGANDANNYDGVFGGGYGSSTSTTGHVEVTINGASVHVYGDVYGGSALGDVNSDGSDHTYVTLTNGTVHHNIYGGGLGDGSHAAQVNGAVLVTVTGGTVTDVFGCNNVNGAPSSTVRVDINNNVTGNVYGGGNLAAASVSPAVYLNGGTIGVNAYGGGYGATARIIGDPVVNLAGSTVTGKVFGGGSAAPVTGDPTVNVSYGTVDSVFGGGLGSTAIVTGDPTVVVNKDPDHTLTVADVFGGGDAAGVTGNTTVTLTAGTISRAFGGGNVADITGTTSVTLQGATAANLYGGGNQASVTSTTSVTVSSGSATAGVYGGCNTSGNVGGNITVALNGGTVGVNNSTTNVVYGGGFGHSTTTGGDVTVTLDGTTVYGNLYGGSAFGSVNGSTSNTTTVTLNSATLYGSVFGGGQGSGTDASTQATTLGNVIVNHNIVNSNLTGIYGGANVNGDVAGNIDVNIEANVGASGNGNSLDVFGGGKGHYTSTGGDVTVTVGNTATSTLYGDLYGGSEEGEVGASGKIAKVDFKKGTLNGTIYGGGKGTNSNAASVTGGTNVTVTTGTITGGIYGGANVNGTVAQNITVNANGGTIGADASHAHVFGGGYGENTSTAGNVTVNINGATVWGDVYGGSALGVVNDESSDVTTVNILAGTVKSDVYGGGLGLANVLDGSGNVTTDNSAKGQVNGVVTVNIGSGTANTTTGEVTDLVGSATINGDVYGCNNTNGSPQQDVTVNIYQTAHTTTDAATYTDDGEHGVPTYAIANVFGGGNQADYNATRHRTTVTVYTCANTIGRIFGGGNAAGAEGVGVTIWGGRFNHVFGGGNGEVSAANIGEEGTRTNVHGGRINQLYGGSNSRGTIAGTMQTHVSNDGPCAESSSEYIDEFFGGANAVPITGNIETTISCGTQFGTVYGGSNQAAIQGNVTLNIEGGTIGTVFGGSKGVSGQDPIAANITDNPNTDGEVEGNVTLNIYGGSIGTAFGGSDLNGNITGAITVNVLDKELASCDTFSLGTLYGSGNLTPYTPTSATTSPVVNVMHIRNGQSITGSIYGGGYGASAGVTANPKVTIGYDASTMSGYTGGFSMPATTYATVGGSVFGGGDAAAVTGNPVVKIQTANTSVTNVYGGGNEAGITGNTNVTLAGGSVTTGIYGGCNATGDVTGNSTVTLNGGTVGSYVGPSGADSGYVTGRIFGGGYGESTNVDGNVHVTLNGATVYGDLYGGSALGKVNTKSSHLTGTVNNTDTVLVDILSGSITGTVYGGGLGRKAVVDDPATEDVDESAAAIAATVHGKVHVNIGATDGNTPATYSGSADFNTYPLYGTTTAGGSVYGCNNTYGSPQNKVYVDVYQCYRGTNELVSDLGSTQYSIADVLGGGNEANYTPGDGDKDKRPYVTIHGCNNTINRVFGGGNAADAVGTHVVVEGGRFNEIFGGGNGAVKAANITPNGAYLNVESGRVGFLFGECNRRGTVEGGVVVDTSESSVGACGPLIIDNHFFGGNFADVIGEKVYTMTCSEEKTYTAVYGGCRLGTVYGNVTLIIEGGTFTNVYAGSLGANDYAANIRKYPTLEQLHADSISGKPEDQWSISPEIHAEWKKPENQAYRDSAGTGGNLTLILRGGTITNAFGGCNMNGSAEGRITVIIDSLPGACPLDVDYIYGGSNLAQYHPDDSTITSPIVELRSGHVNHDVFGGGHGSSDNVNAGLITSNPQVVMGGDKWIDTNYLRVTHDIRWVDAGESKDFWVKGNIYGGGEMGSVGLYERSSGAVTSCTANTGKTTVDLRSGTVGPASMPANFLSAYGSQAADTNFQRDRIVGMVFGGSKGAVGDTTSNPLYSHIAYANETEVIIGKADHTGPFIKGSVYGGAQNGRVYRGGTYVKIQGGQIGCGAGQTSAYSADQWAAASTAVENADTAAIRTSAASMPECPHWVFGRDDNNGKGVEHLPYDLFATNSTADARPKGSDGHTFYGNVFGGGSGYFPYDTNQWLRSAGQVFGSTKVEITGGHILTNLYGGNELTDVTGDSCVVIMTGGTLGVPRSLDSIIKHPVTCYLFGAGKGDERTHFNTWTNVQNVRVSVSGDAHIYGSLLGGGEDGHVMRNVMLTFQDGVLGTTGTSYSDGNVFGGGRGFKGDALTAGNVGGDVTIDISGDNTTKVLGSVYGGGRLASVGYGLYPPDSPNYGKMRPNNQDDAGNTVEGFSRGHITIDIHGSATIGNEIEGDYSAEHSKGGNVFGSSMGRLKKLDDSYLLDLWQNLGSSKQTTVNIYEHAHVRGNVYGGSELGSVTDSTTINIYGDAEIGHLTGGTHYHGDVYGGGYGISTKKFDLSSITRTTLRDSVQQYAGRVYGSTAVNVYGNATLHGDVYGGGEMASVGTEDSLHRGNTLVNIGEYNGGSYRGNATIIGGDVYGCNNIAGTPLGNATVNIYSTAHTTSPDNRATATGNAPENFALANVFGGGNEADYRPNGDPSSSNKHTTVHVYGCDNTIEDLFSGGNAAYAYGVATIIDGGRFNRVFGGGNGEVTTADIGLGGTNTTINAGVIHQLFGGSNKQGTLAGPVNTVVTHTGSCPEKIDEFYAGSNEAPIVGNITTTVECTDDPEKLVNVEEFYGGCNLTDIYGNVTLIVNGGRFGKLFGGSKGSNSKAANIKAFDADHLPLGYPADSIGKGGRVNLYIHGGTIGRAFGGSDVNGNIEGAINVYVNDTSTHCALDLDYVYGGGDLATNDAIDKTITSPYVHLLNGTVNQNVFGGGRGTHDNIEKGKTTANAKVEMTPNVAGGKHFWVKGNIYGGGELAYVGGNATVIINGGKVGPYAPAVGTTRYTLKGCVYGGGLGKPGSTYANFARVGGNTVVSIGANTDTIHGSVFGGGEDGQVLGNTTVTVAGGVIGVPTKYTGDLSELNTYVGNVYGGGRGIDPDASGYLTATAGMVGGNTAVTISGGHVCRSVYGGGSIASVGRDGGVGFKPFDNTKGGTAVTVTGGLIGVYAAPTDNGANANPRYSVNPNATYGNVYGGGRGLPGTSLDGKNNYTNMAYVNNTAVTINYSSVDDSPSGTNHIVGNVYGGADNGSVNNSTSVTVTGGRIGSDGNKDFGSLEGNVFGGGRGEDTYRTYRPGTSTEIDTISPFAGGTYGNTSVLINGETRNSVQVMHHVYGGGANASVGDYDRAAAAVGSGLDETLAKGEVYLLTNANSPSTHPAATDTAGTCKVTVTGGTIGTGGRNNGMIFGASRGDIGAPGSIYDSIAYVNKTIVTIGGGTNSSTALNDFNPLITGSIYGGGENGHTVADAYVYIHDGRVGNHGDMYDRTKTLEDSIETLQKWVKEHPEDAHKDDTLAKIEAFTTEMNSKLDFLSLCGNVYGGGCGTDKYIDINDDNKEKYNSFAGVVFGNATILMDGGYVEHNIYGGGAMANLGRRVGAYVEHTDPETTFALSWPAEIHCRKNTGVARVTVSGSARLGYSGKDNGDIFGASRGEAGVPLSMTKLANVDSTVVLVNITDHAGMSDAQYYGNPATGQLGVNPKNDHSTPLVAGSVYGGAENGHVIRSTNVRMQAGIVGHSIYGGGKGKGTYKTNLWKHTTTDHSLPFDSLDVSVYSLTAGRVYNNTYVTMTGGRVIRSVYGGGNMASVGKGNYAGGPGAYGPNSDRRSWLGHSYGEKWTAANGADLTDILAKTGHTLVYITGGTVGILNPSKPKDSFKDDLPLGNVFGGCRGEAAPAATATQTPRYYYSPGYFSGYTNHTRVIIGDSTVSPVATPTSTSPRIYGSVYGGGQDGHVRNKTVVIINDAEIGVPYVNPSEASALVGVNDISDMHWIGRGNVYGAGSGIGQYDSDGDGEADTYNDASGSVTDSTLIVINGGLIHQNVYGGGALASIGPMILPFDTDKTPDSTWSMARVFVKGGTIGTAGDCSGMYIFDTDTTVFGNYGGNVYGAGHGFAGDTYKNFNNTHHTHIHASGGTINGDVYGGAEDGHVISHTWVNIHSGVTVGYDGLDNHNGNIFGGGRGTISYRSSGRVGGNTHLTVDGGTMLGSIYGGGRSALVGVNEDGTVDASMFTNEGKFDSVNHGYAYVIVKGSPTIGNPNGEALLSTDYSCGDIFGSGKGDIDKYESVPAGRVMNASIHISETPRIYGAVFGGGEMAGVGWWDNTDLYTPLASGFAPSTGTTKVTVAGNATIGTEYEYTKAYLDDHGAWTVVTDGKLTHACTGNIVGASQGDVAPESPHWISMGRSRQSYVDISGTGTIMGNVYGGAEQGVVLENTDVRVSGCTIGTRIVNPNSDVNKAKYISDSTEWKRDSATLVSNWINDSATLVSNWEAAHATWEDEHEAWETEHAAWDPSSGDDEPIEPIEPIKPTRPTAPVPGDTNVYLYSFGSVFGGGYGREVTDRHINDSCLYTINGNDTTWTKLVEATQIAGRTYGNTKVTISGGTIRENVYGGGNMASVGYVREDANHKYNLIDSTKRQTYDDGTGHYVHTNGICTVRICNDTTGTGVDRVITGPIIGPSDHTQMNGHVYGGGKGVGNDPTEYFKNYCNVHETRLTVSGGHIYGSTFGGGADGHVLGHAHTTIEEGAYIGSGEDTQEYDGCVWGGGRNALNINHTAGRVQGHTSVTVTGGRIRRTVQGGGALARTGVDTNGVVAAFCSGTADNGAPIYDSAYHGNTYIYVTADEPVVLNSVLKDGKDYDGNTVTVAGMTDEQKIRNKNFIYSLSHEDSITYKDYLGTTEVRDDGKIVVYKTAIGAYDGPVLVDNDYTIGDIFGGGKGDTKDTTDIMAGRVMNTYVRIDGYPRIMADIYAGGEMSSVGWWDTNRYQFKDDGTYEYSPSRPKNPLHDKYYGGTGYTHLVIGGEPYTGTPYEFSSSCIHYGRPWTLIDSLGRLYHTCSGNVYGGGQGYVEQDGTHYWNWVHMGRVRHTEVTVNGGRFMGNAFGGGARGVVKEDCHVTVTGGCFGNIIYDQPEGFPKDHYYYGSVFGGGYGNHKRFSHISDSSFVLKNGTILKMVPTEQAGRVYGNTYVKITGGQIMDCVYGGGDMASTGWVERDSTTGDFLYTEPGKRHGGKCYVDISGSTIVGPLDYNGHNAYVYAAGRGIGHDSIEYSKTFCNVNEAHLTVHLTTSGDKSTKPESWNASTMGGRIWGSLFGGGADSHVLDSVSVVVHSGLVGTQGTTSYDGNIFGGGRNYLNTNHTNGRVQGNIRVLMDGGTIQGTIFGGGRLALSGVDVDGHFIDSTYGNVDILVCGNATIGNSNADSLLFADESCGDIFGSGKGDIKNYEDIWAGRVTNAKITVKDSLGHSPRIYGSIFGGGEMASLGYWDDTIRDGNDIVFYTTSDEGTNYGVMYENTGRAVINLSGNLTLGTTYEYTVDPDDNPGDWTIYNEDKDTLLHTCTGNVFGGSQGDVDPSAPRWVSMGRSASALVNISGGTYYGNIFGGSEQGVVTGDTRLNISGGNFGYTNQGGSINNQLRKVYSGDIYAAGYGCDDPNDAANLTVELNANDDTVWASQGVPSMVTGPDNDSIGHRATGLSGMPDVLAGRTYGDAQVDLTGGTVQGSVYGGGSFASVGYERSSAKGNTTVNIGKASQVGHAEQGPTIKGEVYGANNFFGTPYGNTNVHIYSTAHTVANTAPTAEYTKTLRPHTDSLTGEDVVALPYADENFALSAVYGGGNKAAHSPFADDGSTLVHVHYCEENTIKTIYGGGNAASTKNNHVVIEGGRIYEVFGGGNGAGVGNPGADVNGTAWTEIHGGLISEVFGGSNSKGVVGNIALDIEPSGTCDIMVANTYGGGNEAAGGGGVVNLLCGTNIGTFYGGSCNADLTGNIVLNVYGGKYESIFGGSKGTESRPANITGNVTVNFYGGHVQRLFGGSDVNGNITGNIVVNVDIDPDYNCPDGLHLDTVYGGGHDAAYTPDVPTNGSPLVNIMNNRYKPAGGGDSAWVEIQDVFGGGLGATAQVTSYPRVIIGGFGGKRGVRIFGNVYGGGSAAPVVGNTYVMVRDATIGRDNAAGSASSGIVFGGGYGSTSNVDGKTHVGIFGLSDIKNNVYGGGNAGTVNGNTELQIAYQEQIQPVDVAIQTVVTPNPPGAPTVAIKASLSCATPGVSIRYVTKPTVQGQPSATNGTLWDGTPFTIDWSDTLQSVAYLPGATPGTIDSSMIPSVVSFGKAAKPVIKIDGDSVKISSSPGVRILYTMDGSEPGRNADGTLKTGTRIHNPVQGKAVLDTVLTDTNQVVRAVSERIGNYPSVVSVLTCEEPTVTISGNQCTITGPAGSKLYYTIDLTNPRSSMAGGTAHGTYVNGNTVTFTLSNENTVVKAIAKKSGYLPSPLAADVYRAPAAQP